MILQFGEFIAEKRKGQGISLRGMADETKKPSMSTADKRFWMKLTVEHALKSMMINKYILAFHVEKHTSCAKHDQKPNKIDTIT